MSTTRKIILLILALPLLSSCSNPEISEVCTGIFITHTLTVLTPEGEPADSVQITVSNKETGNEYDVCNPTICDEPPRSNPYVIFHDGFSEKVDSDGEEIIVRGTKGDKGFTEQFTFRDDGCHIRKVAGPDSVYLQVNKS
ncbi:MAG TPA: hypothetical protein VF181_02965 [Balneolaceae bacterium]